MKAEQLVTPSLRADVVRGFRATYTPVEPNMRKPEIGRDGQREIHTLYDLTPRGGYVTDQMHIVTVQKPEQPPVQVLRADNGTLVVSGHMSAAFIKAPEGQQVDVVSDVSRIPVAGAGEIRSADEIITSDKRVYLPGDGVLEAAVTSEFNQAREAKKGGIRVKPIESHNLVDVFDRSRASEN